MRICSPLDKRARIQAWTGILRTAGILAKEIGSSGDRIIGSWEQTLQSIAESQELLWTHVPDSDGPMIRSPDDPISPINPLRCLREQSKIHRAWTQSCM